MAAVEPAVQVLSMSMAKALAGLMQGEKPADAAHALVMAMASVLCAQCGQRSGGGQKQPDPRR